MAQSAACLTPTPTITPTPLPTGTPAPEATATPTPTPLPLTSFRGQIVFKSDNPDQPGFYAMNPDGSGRQYIGPLDSSSLLAAVRRSRPNCTASHPTASTRCMWVSSMVVRRS